MARDFVGLVARRAARATPVQAGFSEQRSVFQAGSGKHPMPGIFDAVGGAGHDAVVCEHDSQQVRLGLDARMETALGRTLADTLALVPVLNDDRRFIKEIDLAVEAVSPQVQELSAPRLDPALE